MVVPHYFLSTRLCFAGQKQLDCYFPLELYTRIHKQKCTTAIKVCLTHSQHYFFLCELVLQFLKHSQLSIQYLLFVCVCANPSYYDRRLEQILVHTSILQKRLSSFLFKTANLQPPPNPSRFLTISRS